jgi:hypothetical protein
LNFVGISTITGNQTEALNFGLPTITFGPGKSNVAREFIFSGNTVQNSAMAGFTLQPLERIARRYRDAAEEVVTLLRRWRA